VTSEPAADLIVDGKPIPPNPTAAAPLPFIDLDGTTFQPGSIICVHSKVLVSEGDLGGELCPVLEKVIDAYVRRHGYTHTRAQLMRCAKLGL
jgi:hypothetical protein